MLHQKLRKVNIAAKIFRRQSEGEAEGGRGGGGGIPPRPSAEAPPSALLRAEASKKVSFSF
jgi:hypothetical protein